MFLGLIILIDFFIITLYLLKLDISYYLCYSIIAIFLQIIIKGGHVMKVRISSNLQCEVDQRKCDCKREPAHCHVTRNGIRVAQVWLNPVRIESGHSLDRNEVQQVLDVVSSNSYSLMSEYEYNREHGADY